MRKALAIVVALSLIFTSSVSAQAATPKAGKSCKTKGQKVVVKNRQFTCIKRGNKLIWNRGTLVKVATKPTPTPTPTPTPAPTVKEFTRSEVATHNQATDCWSIIGSNVYNLTNWVSRHPGGPAAIVRICGVDGTDRFRGQHSGDNPALRELSAFVIGKLKN